MDDDTRTIASRKTQLIRELTRNAIVLGNQIAKGEAEIKDKAERLKELVEKDLPDALDDAGVKDLTTADGFKVELKTAYFASIAKTKEAALKWLQEHDYSEIVKRTVSVQFDRGEDADASKFVTGLEDTFPDKIPKDEMKIESQTLKKWVKDMIEDGEDIPFDTFGVHVVDYVKITKPKN